MCLIIAGAVTYLTIKMTRTFPDKRIWALVAFTVLTFVVGIVTMSVGISFITKSKNMDEANQLPIFSYNFNQELLQMQFINDQRLTLLSSFLAQAPDGRAPLLYKLISSKWEDTSTSNTRQLSLKFQNGDTVASMNMTLNDIGLKGSVARYEVSWTSDAEWLQPTDCFAMPRTGDGWFGGAEMYYQGWPINSWSKHMSFYLSGDMYNDTQQYGSVMERYWLSTTGVALFVDDDIPLHVSTENYRLCFKGSYDDSPYRVNSTTKTGLPFLKYKMFLALDARQAHEYVFLTSGLLKRPTSLPDERMIKSPIWSTWARYKKNVSQDIVLEYANEILQNGFTNSQLEIDDGYESHYGDYTFDVTKFPDASSMIQQLHDDGFRVTTWVTPFVNTFSTNYDNPQYFVQTGSGRPGTVTWWDGVGRLIDYSSKEACDCYYNNLQQVRDTTGVDSFKFDAGEVNYLTKIPNYQTETFLTNPGTYTSYYANCSHRLGNQIEMRSVWRNQDLPIFVRMMDKDSNWTPAKGLKTIIPTALTFSILGYPYILPDMIGGNGYENGFTGQYVPERELYIRWVELTAFLPAMQFSISPWQYDEEVTNISRYYVELHENIIYNELIDSFQKYIDGSSGIGAIRPLWWIAPDDKQSYFIDDEFLVGEKYLVAPVVQNASRTRDVYLPGPLDYNGQTLVWQDMLRGDTVNGGLTIKDYPVALDEISYWKRVGT